MKWYDFSYLLLNLYLNLINSLNLWKDNYLEYHIILYDIKN